MMNSKALTLLLALGIAGTVAACGGADTGTDAVDDGAATEEVAPADDMTAPMEDPAAAPAEEGAPAEGGEGGEG